MQTPATVEELEDELSRPTAGVLETFRRHPGDVVVLGCGGKIGPTLTRMIARSFQELGQATRRVVGVSRFSTSSARDSFEAWGIETVPCDLLDRGAVDRLPEAPLVVFLAGQKFGTQEAPARTWATNTLIPVHVAQRYSRSHIVALSTGCVYPLVPAHGPGSVEGDPLTPPGEYANSCVARERIFEYFSGQNATPMVLVRLCYAIDLRYGVLVDLAQRIWAGLPVDVTMGATHVIWQGDASARILQCFDHTSVPPNPVNLTGRDRLSIRDLAGQLGQALGRDVRFSGTEGATAWLWNAQRSYDWFGPPEVSLSTMIQATADWIRRGGPTLGKPTHFEVVDGTY